MTAHATALAPPMDAAAAAHQLAGELLAGLGGARPDAVLLFASPAFDLPVLVRTLREATGTPVLVGASSAGEFTSAARKEGAACAVAIRSDELKFAPTLGRGVGLDPLAAADQLVARLGAGGENHSAHRALLLFADALAGHMEELVGHITLLTSGRYLMAGGGAGDDGRFHETFVFMNDDVYKDAVVGLEILSPRPMGVGVAHGWTPASAPMRVTEAGGPRVVSLNATPALEVLDAHAAATGQKLDVADPMPFFLHNILGVPEPGGHRLRVALAADRDGALTCAAEIPEGARVQIMQASTASSQAAAESAATSALAQMDGQPAHLALFFDCVATRLRMGTDFDLELAALGRTLKGVPFAGFNTYGQIARAPGQFNGFHNCTAVVLLLP